MPSTLSSSHWPKTERLPSLLRIVLVLMGFLPSAPVSYTHLPYDVLDAILLRYVDQEQSRDEIVGAGFDAATVDKVLRLVHVSEWKRHQAAPGPKVSRRAFGRERRYPITNGYWG